MPRSQHCALGKTGEDLACAELRRRGYAILDRRYRTRGGELDIIARDGPTLVFVEVKTRGSTRFGSPLEAVTAAKRRQVVAMAADYLARRRPRGARCRFDVAAVTFDAQGRPAIEIVTDAFAAGE
jgi:putative endonuclease